MVLPPHRVARGVFAMTVHGALVVKLPRARVAQLAAGYGAAFSPGGRATKEWVIATRAARIERAKEAVASWGWLFLRPDHTTITVP